MPNISGSMAIHHHKYSRSILCSDDSLSENEWIMVLLSLITFGVDSSTRTKKKQTNKQPDEPNKQTNKQPDEPTKQTNKQTNKQPDEPTKQTNKQTTTAGVFTDFFVYSIIYNHQLVDSCTKQALPSTLTPGIHRYCLAGVSEHEYNMSLHLP